MGTKWPQTIEVFAATDSILAMNTHFPSVVCGLILFFAAVCSAQGDSLRLHDTDQKRTGSLVAFYRSGILWQEAGSSSKVFFPWKDVAQIGVAEARSIAFGSQGEKVVGKPALSSGDVLSIEGTLLGSVKLSFVDLPPRPKPSAPPAVQTPLKPSDWKGRVAVGTTLAAGNRDVLSGKIDALLERDFRYDHIEFRLSAIYGKANGVLSNNSQSVGSRYKHFFQDDLYGFAGLEFSRDPVKDLSLRGLLNLGAGWTLWDGGKDRKLSLEAGVGFRHENIGNETRNDGTARVAVFFSEVLFSDVTLKQKVEGIIPVVDFAAWLGRMETTISVPLSENWSFRTHFKLDYQAQPAIGKDPLDFLATTGLEYRF